MVTYLRERELVTSVYLERLLPIRLENGEHATAVSYVIDRSHKQYAGRLSVEDAARVVSGGVGISGRNEDYLFNTVDHLKALGIRDHWLEGVAALVPR